MSFPDRTLRRMVVDLAALHADDIAAVLAQLEPRQRGKVEALLRELSDFGFGERISQSQERGRVDASQLSPWLVDRLAEERSDIGMTALARAKLRDCAVRLFPLPSPTTGPATKRGVRLFGKSAVGAGAAE
jgi:hypothetical protein